MKILALHLPAYHRIKENDLWWGEGFTEWNNVRSAKPLYKGHIQPLIPFNDNYYDLSKNDEIEKQSILAKKYGIDGFIFYHYWFGGHKLFEKPIENYRDNVSIQNFGYSLCWANESWTRSWDGKNKDILIEQIYGDKNDWINHINYLLPFFKDKKYIKINNRPVFYIYSANQFPNFDEMITCWNEILKDNGIEELFIIEFMRSKNNKPASKFSYGVIEFEPLYTIRYDISIFKKIKRYICSKLKIVDFQNYDVVWKKILNRRKLYNEKIIFKSCFTSWDNSPRKGLKNSIILKGSSPKKFERYFYELLSQNRQNASNDMIVVNAWNEWGEGAILEPTKQYEFKYLEAIKKAKEKYLKNV